MRLLLTLAITLFLIFNAQAQKTMSLKDAILGNGSYLKPSVPEKIAWKNNQTYLMVTANNLVQENILDNKSTELISLTDLNKELSKNGISEAARFPAYSVLNDSCIWFHSSNQLVVFNTVKKSIETVLNYPKDAENTDFCKTNSSVAFTVKNNLYIAGKSDIRQITNDENPHIINGSSVHRNEFGITKGTFWSPSGKHLAFYRMDETMVGDYPLVDYMAREAKLNNVKYPMAGMKSHQVTLAVYNLETQKTLFLKTGKSDDHYLTNICWGPDEKSIYMAELNREQNHLKLNQYSAISGEFLKTILEERNEKYVEPTHPIQFSITNPDQFYFQSRQDGWNHVYLYSTTGELVKQITQGNWEVTEILGFDQEEKNMIFEATKESPIERHLYAINLRNGKIVKLTGDAGTHSGIISPDGHKIIDVWTSTDVPGKVDLISEKGEILKSISKAENTLKDYDLGENTVFTIKAADEKTDLYCRMIKPNNFDPEKKYPVIVYVYGGPHAQLVNKTWLNDARWWQYYMASKGFIAFTVDSRGSDNRGLEFENVIHRQLGVPETADQMKGIDYLKSLPYVDANRIGVHGWSYGGFMTLNLMLKHPETFKVGVAGGPVVDWSLYEVMYGERYMDTPEENPEGYKNANMLNYIDKLEGKLMLIHGTQDQTVVMQHSIQFLKKCVDKEKQVDFFVYPTYEHNVRGKDRVHLMEKVSNYFLENL
ncbi:MAG: S9 family peptidase [Prolixibacteraceae bacterium]